MKRRADGRFQKRITLSNGKSKVLYSSASSEREAVKDFNRQMLELDEERRASLDFDRVAEAWSSERFPTLQNNSLKQYRPCLKEAVTHFGATPIADISVFGIKGYLDMLNAKGYAKKTVKERYAILKQIFNFAIENEYIEKNPCLTVKLKFSASMSSSKREAATASEAEAIKNVSDDVPFGFFAKFSLLTGCRRGEALALTPEDISLEKRTVSINKTVEWVGNKPQIKPQPKTFAGNREIPIPASLVDQLKTRMSQPYIFCNANGELLNNSQVTRLWRSLQNELDLSCTPHQLRHSYATMLFDAGIDVKTAQRWLGHTDIKTTLDIYTHLSEQRQEQSVDKWFAFLKNMSK